MTDPNDIRMEKKVYLPLLLRWIMVVCAVVTAVSVCAAESREMIFSSQGKVRVAVTRGDSVAGNEVTRTVRKTVAKPLVPLEVLNPLESDAELPDEDGYAAFFRPVAEANGNYLPMGQLSRNLILVRFKPRGYDNRYTKYYVNGADVSGVVDGMAYWNILSGVSAVSRVHADVYGLAPGESAIGSVGGITSVSAGDTLRNSYNRFSYAATNRNYANRLTYNGQFQGKNGGLSSVGVNRRWGRDGYVDGVFTDLTTGTVSFSRRFGKHTLALLYTGTYGEQGVRSAATQEVYDLAGNNYYNPNWGYQNGKIRNNKVRGYGQNFAVLSHEVTFNPKLMVKSTLSAYVARNSFSLLTWYDAPTPYADYYRSLPGFFGNTEVSDALRQEWAAGNSAVTQIDWRELYEANRYNTAPGVDGSRSHYAVRDLVTDRADIGFSTYVRYRYDNTLTLSAGADVRIDRSSDYGRMDDLLGGDYWIDIDQYLLDDEYYGDKIQNDVRNPGRLIRKGDRFGYDYDMSATRYDVWGAADYRQGGWQATLGVQAGKTSYRRTGNYEKEMYPGNLSYGKSARHNFGEYAVKAAVSRYFTMRHRVGLQLLAEAVAPLAADLFVAPSYRNAVADEAVGRAQGMGSGSGKGVGTVRVLSAEVGYQFVMPHFRAGVSGYATRFSGGSDIRSYYDDIESDYLNLVMTSIDKIHAGIEASAEVSVSPKFSVSAVVTWNVYKYDSDPDVALLRDSDGEVLLRGAKSYMAGYRLSGTPQCAGMVQLRYRLPYWWQVSLSASYAGNNYVSMNPVRRMTRALDLSGSPEVRREMLAQEKLGDAVTVGATVSKNFRLGNGHVIGLWVQADNLLNDRSIRYGGYEQMRFTKSTAAAGRTLVPFAPKYYYAYGANYYCMLSYTF